MMMTRMFTGTLPRAGTEASPTGRGTRATAIAVAFIAFAIMLSYLGPAPASAGYGMVAKWGSEGQGDGQFNGPHGVAVSADSSVYVADRQNNRIQKFTAEGGHQATWGGPGPGWGDGEFFGPRGVATSPAPLEASVYVTDPGSSRVQKLDPNGGFIREWGESCTLGFLDPVDWYLCDGNFSTPQGIDVSPTGNVYVADYFNHRIQKFDSEGNLLGMWGSDGSEDDQFRNPSDVAVSPGGDIYVTDTWNNRIKKFTEDGVFITNWGGSGTDDGQLNHPMAVAVDLVGDMYVADTDNNRIQKFTAEGIFITKWGGECSLPEDPDPPDPNACDDGFNKPYGIAVSADERVYVSERDNNRVQVFIDLAPVNVTPPVITGLPHVGETVACSEDEWKYQPTDPFTYGWLRDGDEISGGTDSTYTLDAADEGSAVSCEVTATNDAGSSDAAVSETIEVTFPPPPPSPPPLPSPPTQPLPAPAPLPALPAPLLPATPSAESQPTEYSRACNLRVTSPRLKIGKSRQVKISTGSARRLFTRGLKGYINWGRAGGRDVVCKKVRMTILEKRGHSHYLPGTKVRVPARYLTAKSFSTKGSRFLRKKRVGRLRQRRNASSGKTKVSFKEFNRKSRLGRSALRKLGKKRYRGTYVILYTAEVNGAAFTKKVVLKVRGKREAGGR